MSTAADAISPPAPIAPAATSPPTDMAVETGFAGLVSTLGSCDGLRCRFFAGDAWRFEIALTALRFDAARFAAVFAGLCFLDEARLEVVLAALRFLDGARFADVLAALLFLDEARFAADFLDAAVFAAERPRALPPVRDFDAVVLGDLAMTNSLG